MLRVLESENEYITVLSNNKFGLGAVTLVAPDEYKPAVIFGDTGRSMTEKIKLNGRETVVIRWTKE